MSIVKCNPLANPSSTPRCVRDPIQSSLLPSLSHPVDVMLLVVAVALLLNYCGNKSWVATGFVVEKNSQRSSIFFPSKAPRPLTSTQLMSTTNSKKSSWKTVPKTFVSPPADGNEEDHTTLLHDRTEWSRESFRDALEFYHQLTDCQDSYVKGPIEQALNSLSHAYRLYGPESVICSFNGGKDAVVILHLTRAAHAHYYNSVGVDDSKKMVQPRVIYFDHSKEFQEIRSFVKESVEEFELDMICFAEGINFSDGLKILVEQNYPRSADGGGILTTGVTMPLAFVLGTRTTDPNAGKQGQFAPSSHYMPPFMRVNPVLDWTYGHVWHFLRQFELPYCSLYDQGYTSLGNIQDTVPCPALAVAGGDGDVASIPRYWPAYMLRDWDQERAGRIPKRTAPTQTQNKSAKQQETETSSVASSSLGQISTMSLQRTKPNLPPEDEDSSCVSYGGVAEVQRTVGLLIIGDEILKGLTHDTNSQAAAVALRKRNVLLKRVVVVSDSTSAIVDEINRLQKEVDVIITSGGVGPTHDDVTLKSVAEALGCEMILHEEMGELLLEKMKLNNTSDLTPAQQKMATLPEKSKLRYLSENPNDWPVLQCKNIFILPGVPDFFAPKVDNVAEYLSCQLERSVAYKVVLRVDENSIVPALNAVVENHPNVTIGSYPFVSHPEYKTVITVEGRLLSGGRSNSSVFSRGMIDALNSEKMDQQVQVALDELINTLPEGSVLRVDNNDLSLFD